MAGRPKEVSDEEILRAVLLSPDPVVTTTEISGKVDMTRQGIHDRFRKFREQGYMHKKTVGSKSVVWWLTYEAKRKVAGECD